MSDVFIRDTWSVDSTWVIDTCIRAIDIPRELYPGHVTSFLIVEDSMLGILPIIGRQGDKIQFLESHPRKVYMEAFMNTNEAKAIFDRLEIGGLYRIYLRQHEQTWMEFFATLTTKNVEYPSTGGEAAVSTVNLFFVEDEWFAWKIRSEEHVNLTVRDSETFTITGLNSIVTSSHSETFTITGINSIVTSSHSETFTITSTYELAIT